MMCLDCFLIFRCRFSFLCGRILILLRLMYGWMGFVLELLKGFLMVWFVGVDFDGVLLLLVIGLFCFVWDVFCLVFGGVEFVGIVDVFW